MERPAWNEIRKSLPDRSSSVVTLMVFGVDLALIMTSWALRSSEHLGLKLASYPLLMLAVVHLYLILHEAAHKLVSRRLSINNGVGHFCGWFITLPFLPRQRNHLGHHAWAGHPTKDPENRKLIEKYRVLTNEEVAKRDFVWKSWFPLIGINHIRDTWKDPFQLAKTEPKSPRYPREKLWAWIYVVGYILVLSAAIHFGCLGRFLSWYFPAWFGFMMFIELANLPHHAETPLLAEGDKMPHPSEQDRLSHNCKPTPIWSKCVMLNFNLHVYHHLFPNVPWYALKVIPDSTPSRSEIGWALHNRKRSLVELMAHYFDKRKKA